MNYYWVPTTALADFMGVSRDMVERAKEKHEILSHDEGGRDMVEIKEFCQWAKGITYRANYKNENDAIRHFYGNYKDCINEAIKNAKPKSIVDIMPASFMYGRPASSEVSDAWGQFAYDLTHK